MKITQREKIMLSFLLIVGLLAGGFYLIYTPLNNQADLLNQEYQAVQVQKKDIDQQLASYDQINKSVNDLTDTINQSTVAYYPSILQEKIILVLNDLVTGSGIVVSNIAYVQQKGLTPQLPDAAAGSAAAQTAQTSGTAAQANSLTDAISQLNKMDGITNADAEEQQSALQTVDQAALTAALQSVSSLTATIQFTGTYDQVRYFMTLLENMNRSVQVTNITYTTGESGFINGTLNMNFYAIPKLVRQDDDYLTWK
ncbi:MAG: hypothetical protein VB070_13540 [Clostridiaceae bacterium]|nr:hypothetical protein [Clostridiaceae bacterium]